MTGRPGKWPWKNHSVAVTALSPTIRSASGSYSTIRSTSRNGQRCGMSASISRVVWTIPGRSAGVGSGRSRAAPAGRRQRVGRVVAVGPSLTARPPSTRAVRAGVHRVEHGRRRVARLTAAPRRRRTRRCRPGRAGSSSSARRGRPRCAGAPGGSATFVTSPSTTSSSRAARARSIAAPRSRPQTMSLPSSES